jgi:mannose-6-phosphate isomerase
MAQPVLRERLFDCEHFKLWSCRGEKLFTVGAPEKPRVLVCIAGAGQLVHDGAIYDVSKGDVMLLPAVVGVCSYQPRGEVSLLEIALPEVA